MTRPTPRIAWFNCSSGVAGDMTLASLVDAGADPDDVVAAVGALGVDGHRISFERVQRCGVAATWTDVAVDRDDRHHRSASEILGLLGRAPLATRVRDRAHAVFVALADAEGAVHDVDPATVEFHEVGSLDAIIDVVGVAAALESLGIDEVHCGPVALGVGSVATEHGRLPNPAPATLALLAAVAAPTVGIDTSLEVTTPTGAALVATLASRFGAVPSMVPTSIGYGAGTADPPERANVVQVVIGDAIPPDDHDGTPVTLLETNVDDVTGEVLAHVVAALLGAGAHDAWATPIVMKKGRPAHTVSVLCDPAAAPAMRSLLRDETGSLGMRATAMVRWPQRRESTTVNVDGHDIRVKLAGHRVKVEFDDAAAAAAALGVPVRVVLERAQATAGIRAGGVPGDP